MFSIDIKAEKQIQIQISCYPTPEIRHIYIYSSSISATKNKVYNKYYTTNNMINTLKESSTRAPYVVTLAFINCGRPNASLGKLLKPSSY